MKIKVIVKIEDNVWRKSSGLLKNKDVKIAIKETILRVCGKQFSKANFVMGICFTNDKEITEMNKEYLQNNSPTDVLSFPDIDFSSSTWKEVFGTGPKENYLGSVFISYETTLKDVNKIECKFSDRVTHLIVHSTLHILGFDHYKEEDRVEMEKLESEILNNIGITDTYSVFESNKKQ